MKWVKAVGLASVFAVSVFALVQSNANPRLAAIVKPDMPEPAQDVVLGTEETPAAQNEPTDAEAASFQPAGHSIGEELKRPAGSDGNITANQMINALDR